MRAARFQDVSTFSRISPSKCSQKDARRRRRRRRERCSRLRDSDNAIEATNDANEDGDDGAFVQQPQVAPSTSASDENETTIVFVAEDELYSISLNANDQKQKIRPHRLTTATGECFSPLISKCGTFVVFAAIEYYAMELFLVPTEGGAVKQITYMGADFIRPLSFRMTGVSCSLLLLHNNKRRTKPTCIMLTPGL